MGMPSVKPRWPRSFRARLLAVYLAGMVVSAGVVGVGAMALAEPFNRYMLQYGAIKYAEAISKRVQFDGAGKPIGLDETMIERWLFSSLQEEVILLVLDAQGSVIYASVEKPKALAPAGTSFDPSRTGFALIHDGVSMHAATVLLTDRESTWYVQLAVSDRLVLHMRQSIGTPALQQGILVTCFIFLAVFLVTTHLTLQRMLKPLRLVSEEAQRITPQSLDARLESRNLPSELTPLVDAFNRALDRLQKGFQTQQDFLANAAHELKTPLALIRAQVELDTPHQSSAHLLQDVDRMARQVQQLLHLAEASELRNYRIEPIDPRSIVAEACDYMERVAARSSIQIRVEFEDFDGYWNADRGALFTLLKNLLENAIQHSPKRSIVTLTVRSNGFVVSDQGSGVPEEHLARIFERFWRGAARRDEGAGLGLSICQEIASAHHWHIEARSGTVGLEIHVLQK